MYRRLVEEGLPPQYYISITAKYQEKFLEEGYHVTVSGYIIKNGVKIDYPDCSRFVNKPTKLPFFKKRSWKEKVLKVMDEVEQECIAMVLERERVETVQKGMLDSLDKL